MTNGMQDIPLGQDMRVGWEDADPGRDVHRSDLLGSVNALGSRVRCLTLQCERRVRLALDTSVVQIDGRVEDAEWIDEERSVASQATCAGDMPRHGLG